MSTKNNQKYIIKELIKELNKKQKTYLSWLKLPRYQTAGSEEYYADIQAIAEDMENIKSNLSRIIGKEPFAIILHNQFPEVKQ